LKKKLKSAEREGYSDPLGLLFFDFKGLGSGDLWTTPPTPRRQKRHMTGVLRGNMKRLYNMLQMSSDFDLDLK
jgi:hypothetical protein